MFTLKISCFQEGEITHFTGLSPWNYGIIIIMSLLEISKTTYRLFTKKNHDLDIFTKVLQIQKTK